MSVTRGPEMSNTAGRVGFKGYRNLHFGLGFPTGESRLGRGGWTGLPVAHSVISHRWVADVSSSRFGAEDVSPLWRLGVDRVLPGKLELERQGRGPGRSQS